MRAIVITGGRFTTGKITLGRNEAKNPLKSGFTGRIAHKLLLIVTQTLVLGLGDKTFHARLPASDLIAPMLLGIVERFICLLDKLGC
jgi:hypothetical protein